MPLSPPLNAPFYLGGITVSTVPEPYQAALDGHPYVIEPTLYKRSFVDQLRPATDQSAEPGEVSLNNRALWRRSASSWDHGAGQIWFDSSPDSDRHRFRASKGVDVWTPFQLSLLPACNTVKDATADTTGTLIPDPARGELWFVHGTGVRHTVNPSADAPTWTACTGLPGSTITGWTFTGAHCYVVAGQDVYRCAIGSTVFASWYSATDVDGVTYANGRLFGWDNATGAIFELTAAAGLTALFTHPQGASFDWDVVVGAPNATYLVGHVGFTSEIYRTQVTDATGALAAPILSGVTLNERVTAAVAEGGYLVLATKMSDGAGRIRLAGIQNALSETGGGLVVGPNMFAPLAQAPASAVTTLFCTGQYVYFGWTNLDTVSTGCGRLDLATFTQPLVPAYASDQMAGATGTAVQGACLAVVVDPLSAQVWQFISGVGLVGTANARTLVALADNYLDTGRIRFGLLDTKVFSSIDLHCIPTAGTPTITATVTRDDGTATTAITYTGTQSGPPDPVELDHTVGEWIDIRFALGPATATTSPKLSWWVLRAIPVPGAISRILLPVILRDYVRVGPDEQAVEVGFDVEAELGHLRSLVASRSIVTYQTGSSTEGVYVNNLEEQATGFALGNRHFQGVVLVEMLTVA